MDSRLLFMKGKSMKLPYRKLDLMRVDNQSSGFVLLARCTACISLDRPLHFFKYGAVFMSNTTRYRHMSYSDLLIYCSFLGSG